MRGWFERVLDWLCSRLGVCIRFDGDLMAPSGDEEWWADASAKDG